MNITKYRVLVSCFEPNPDDNLDARREAMAKHLAEAIPEQKPDLVVLPELVLWPDLDQVIADAEDISGQTISLIAEIAGQYKCNICVPILERRGDRIYNIAVYVDREGHIAGAYEKHTLTQAEMELGITPGKDNPDVVVLDGVKIGTAICFDENYPDLLWNWIEKKVDLLIFPAYTYGGALMAAWAKMAAVPLVSAFPWQATIYDRDGSLLAKGGTWTTTLKFGFHPPWLAHTLDMNSRVYHLDYNQPKIREIQQKYGSDVDIRLMVDEARMLITVKSGNLSIRHIEKDMSLIPLADYLAKTRAMADAQRTELL